MLAKLDFKAIFLYSPSKSLALKWPKNMLVQTLKREKQAIKKKKKKIMTKNSSTVTPS